MLVEEAVEAVSIVRWQGCTSRPCWGGGTNSPRVESAHGVIAFQSTIHDSCVALLRDALFGHLRIDPFGEAPHFRADLAKLDGGGGIVLDSVLEGLIEVAIVQENVRVVVPAVEVALDRLD